MKRFVTLFLSLLILASVTMLVLSNAQDTQQALRPAPAALDDLLDELLYISELSTATAQRTLDPATRDLAVQTDATAKALNRQLCSYVIETGLEAKQELHDDHRQGVFSLINAHRDRCAQRYTQLLVASLQKVEQLQSAVQSDLSADAAIFEELQLELQRLEVKLGLFDEQMALR